MPRGRCRVEVMLKKVKPEYILNGPIVHALVRLALPTTAAFVFQTMFNFVDRFYVSRLGEIQLAAVGMAFTMQSVLIAVGAGVGVGTSSIVARRIGAGKPEDARRHAEHSLLIALIAGIVFALGGSLVTGPFFRLLGASQEMLPYILEYINVILSGSVFIFISMVGSGILRGEGNTVTPMRVMLTGTLVNIVLDPILIFGLGPIPAFGVAGAAAATVIARVISALLFLSSLLSPKNLIRLRPRLFLPQPDALIHIFGVGGPAIITRLVNTLILSMIFILLRPFGDHVKAAFTIGFTYQQVAFMPLIGLGTAVLPMVGQNFGARKASRVERGIWAALLLGAGVSLVFTLLAVTLPMQLLGLFSDSPDVLSAGFLMLIFTALSFPFSSSRMISANCFQALGRGVSSMTVNLILFAATAFPVALFLAPRLAETGVWIGMFTGNLIAGIGGALWVGGVGRRLRRESDLSQKIKSSREQ
jgi:MATE family, multidrug efflux pump